MSLISFWRQLSLALKICKVYLTQLSWVQPLQSTPGARAKSEDLLVAMRQRSTERRNPVSRGESSPFRSVCLIRQLRMVVACLFRSGEASNLVRKKVQRTQNDAEDEIDAEAGR